MRFKIKTISVLVLIAVVATLVYSLNGNGDDTPQNIRLDGPYNQNKGHPDKISSENPTNNQQKDKANNTVKTEVKLPSVLTVELVPILEYKFDGVRFDDIRASHVEIRLIAKKDKHVLYAHEGKYTNEYIINAHEGEYDLIVTARNAKEYKKEISFTKNNLKQKERVELSLANYRLRGNVESNAGGKINGSVMVYRYDEKAFEFASYSGVAFYEGRYSNNNLSVNQSGGSLRDGKFEISIDFNEEPYEEYVVLFYEKDRHITYFLENIRFSYRGELLQNGYVLNMGGSKKPIIVKTPKNITAISYGSNGRIAIEEKKSFDMGYARYTDEETNDAIIRKVEHPTWRTAMIKIVNDYGNPIPYADVRRIMPSKDGDTSSLQRRSGDKDGVVKIRFADPDQATFEIFASGYKSTTITLSDNLSEIEESVVLKK